MVFTPIPTSASPCRLSHGRARFTPNPFRGSRRAASPPSGVLGFPRVVILSLSKDLCRFLPRPSTIYVKQHSKPPRPYTIASILSSHFSKAEPRPLIRRDAPRIVGQDACRVGILPCRLRIVGQPLRLPPLPSCRARCPSQTRVSRRAGRMVAQASLLAVVESPRHAPNPRSAIPSAEVLTKAEARRATAEGLAKVDRPHAPPDFSTPSGVPRRASNTCPGSTFYRRIGTRRLEVGNGDQTAPGAGRATYQESRAESASVT